MGDTVTGDFGHSTVNKVVLDTEGSRNDGGTELGVLPDLLILSLSLPFAIKSVISSMNSICTQLLETCGYVGRVCRSDGPRHVVSTSKHHGVGGVVRYYIRRCPL